MKLFLTLNFGLLVTKTKRLTRRAEGREVQDGCGAQHATLRPAEARAHQGH